MEYRGTAVIHIVLNNEAHESVGGMPTVAGLLDLPGIARACGYPNAISVDTLEELNNALAKARAAQTLYFIEVKCALGSREDLGRSVTTPAENKLSFMVLQLGEQL